MRQRNMMCIAPLVATAALLGATSAAHADALTINPALTSSGPGTSIALAGVGLKNTGTGPIDIMIGGPVVNATLYFGGRGEPLTTMVMLDATLVNGVSIGTEVTPNFSPAYAFRADVTDWVNANFSPPGLFSFNVQDLAGGAGTLDGASLLVTYIDEVETAGWGVQVFEGSDYGYHPNLPDPAGFLDPAVFMYDPAAAARNADLAVVFGDTEPGRPDEIEISDNPTIINALVGADGPEWDSHVFSVGIPAGVMMTTVQPISPIAGGTNSDSLHWVTGALRVPCAGAIGDFVWEDLDGDGCQGPDEPGIDGVMLTLYYIDGGNMIMIGQQMTANGGAYLFGDLCAGDYEIHVDPATVPAGYVETTPFSGNCDPTLDSNCVNGVMTVTLPANNTVDLTIDCGLVPPPGGGEGCTPGYWKQPHHFFAWTAPYEPTTLFSDVFEDAFPGMTLLQVLWQGGGGLNALGRHTVAALLNAASPDVAYDLTTQEVIDMFNDVYPGTRDEYNALKDYFEGFNESGCPLGNSGSDDGPRESDGAR